MLSLVKNFVTKRRVPELRSSLRANQKQPFANWKKFGAGEGTVRKVLEDFYEEIQRRPRMVGLAVAGGVMFCMHKYFMNKCVYTFDDKGACQLKEELKFVSVEHEDALNSFIRARLYKWPYLTLKWDEWNGKKWGNEKPKVKKGQFVDVENLDEFDYSQVSTILNYEEAISLARGRADIRLLKPPEFPDPKSVDELVNSLHNMVLLLTSYPINKCLTDQVEISFRFMASSFESVDAQSLVESSGFDAVSGDTIPQRRVSRDTAIMLCLTAILAHSVAPEQIPVLMELNVLDHLAEVYNEYKDNPEVASIIIKILGNITVDTSTRGPVYESGCLYILAKCARDVNNHLSFAANRALLNLDRKDDGCILMNGVYQMYPLTRRDEEGIEYDVVFIHGLLGSAAKTWRRQELSSFIEDLRHLITEIVKERHTDYLASSTLFTESVDLHDKKKEMLANSIIPGGMHSQLTQMTEQDIVRYIEHWPEDAKVIEDPDQFYPHNINGVISEDTHCWPRDWLPLDCPNARIINIEFESYLSNLWPSCPIERYDEGLKFRAGEIKDKLLTAGIGKRPVVFVCHSMGGLIMKHVIVNSDLSNDPKFKAISQQTKSLFFYSTPHYGSATGKVLLDAGGNLLYPTKELTEISGTEESIDDLVNLQEKFSLVYEKYKYGLINLSETRPSAAKFGYDLFLVPRYSSDMGHGENYALWLDHLNICKPFCRRSFVYAKLVAHLQSYFPSKNPVIEIHPFLLRKQDANHEEVCARLGLGKYMIVDPHLIRGIIRGPKEVIDMERINRESGSSGP